MKNIIIGIIITFLAGIALIHYERSYYDDDDTENDEVTITTTGPNKSSANSDLYEMFLFAKDIPYGGEKNNELQKLFERAISENSFDIALKIADEVTYASVSNILYRDLALVSAKNGEAGISRQAAEKIPYTSTKNQTIRDVLSILNNPPEDKEDNVKRYSADTKEELLELLSEAEKINSSTQRDSGYAHLFARAVNANQLDLAFEIAHKVNSSTTRSSLLSRLAIESRKRGRNELSNKAVDGINSSTVRDATLLKMLEVQTEANPPSEKKDAQE